MQRLTSPTIASLTQKELSEVYDIADNIIDNLPPQAIMELLEGDERGVKGIFDDIVYYTNQVINNNAVKIGNFSGLPNFEKSFDESLKIQSLNYFGATMLPNFTMGWRNIEFGNLIQLYPYSAYLASRGCGKSYMFCFMYPLWKLWRYRKPGFFQRQTIDNKNSRDIVIITCESSLGEIHLGKIVAEIKSNELLQEVLLPQGRDLGKEKLVCKNEANIILRSYGSSGIRGLHVGTVIVDDFLNKSAIYSQKARDGFKSVFYDEINPIVNLGGSLIISGTPFAIGDLYTDLKKDDRFKVFEYPAIDINGKILAPDLLPYDLLMKVKRSLGTIVFSREYLVTAISDASSIFPWEYLNTSLVGMEKVDMVENIESFPIKMKRVVVGVDFAISGNVAADWSVFSVWGIDSNNFYYLLHLERGQGWSHNEQVGRIVRLNHAFKPNVIIAENNGFQRVLIELVKERGVKNIKEFTTTSFNKKDDKEGLPSISAMFERCEIKIPNKEGRSKEIAMQLLSEFNSIGFDDEKGKLQSIGSTDDMVMSSFFSLWELRQKTGFKVHMIG